MTADEARKLLEAEGYTVVTTAAYRRAQERQRLAEFRRADAEHEKDSTRLWALEALDDERYLRDRCSYLYGLAAAHGATEDELRGFFDRASWDAQRIEALRAGVAARLAARGCPPHGPDVVTDATGQQTCGRCGAVL